MRATSIEHLFVGRQMVLSETNYNAMDGSEGDFGPNANVYDITPLQIPEKQWGFVSHKKSVEMYSFNQEIAIPKPFPKEYQTDFRYAHNRSFIQINDGRFLLFQREYLNEWSYVARYKYQIELIPEYSTTTTSEETVAESEIDDANLKRKFDNLAETWKIETQFASTVMEIAMHRAYQQIIGMGSASVPFILHRLEKEPDHWFWALKAITGEDPVPENYRGNLKEMTKAWIEWGEKHGYGTN